MKRRGNSEGSIQKRPDGSWRVQLRMDGRRLSFSAETRQECQAWIRKTLDQIDIGLSFSGAQTTLKEFLEGWLIGIKTALRPTTWYQYNMTANRYIIPAIGKIKLKDLRPDIIQNLYQKRIQGGSGIRTVQIIHITLHKALDHAVKTGLIGRNPTESTTPPRQPDHEMRFYDESQANQLLLAACEDRNEALYQLVLATGCRQSEVLGLKWSDLDLGKKSLTIQRQLKRNGQKGDYYISPKTRGGRRTVVLGKRTIDKLREHLKRQEMERSVIGDRWQENDLIFPSSVGTPMNQSNLFRSFKVLIKKAGLPDLPFHGLRHTAASLTLNHGVPAIIVSRRLGHSKVSITLDIYGHLMPEMQNDAAELIDDLITPVEIKWPQNGTKESNVIYRTI